MDGRTDGWADGRTDGDKLTPTSCSFLIVGMERGRAGGGGNRGNDGGNREGEGEMEGKRETTGDK